MPPRDRRSRIAASRDARRSARSQALEAQVSAWMLRYTQRLADRMIAEGSLPAAERKRFVEQLERIIRTHTVRLASDAARRIAAENGIEGEIMISPAMVQDYVRRKRVLVQGIERNARDFVQRQLAERLNEYRREVPRPSAGEIARRLRTEYVGRGGGRPISETEAGGGAIFPTTRVGTEGARGEKPGPLFAFSSERAALIARTEAVQADNFGIVAGASSVGADAFEWLAVTSGEIFPRRHDLMDGVIVAAGQPFRLPPHEDTGVVVYMDYPGDPAGGIGQIANCRCSVRPIFFAAEPNARRRLQRR